MSTILIKDNQDLNLPYSLSIGKVAKWKEEPREPGVIIYNSELDRFEGYMANEQPYNGTNFAPLSLSIATADTLGGIKIGNNLSVTASGILNAIAEYSSQKLQKYLSVSTVSGVADYTSINNCLSNFFGFDSNTGEFSEGELLSYDRSEYPFPRSENKYVVNLLPGIYNEEGETVEIPPNIIINGIDRDSVIINIDATKMFKLLSNSGGNQIISNITFKINRISDTDITQIIDLSNCSNITLHNIKFIGDVLNGNDLTFINASSSANIKLSNIEMHLTSLDANINNQNINFLNAINSSISINNCNINISANRGKKTILNISNNSTIDILNSYFTINEINTVSTNDNKFCLVENSNLKIKHSDIIVNGFDILLNETTQQNNAIVINNDTVRNTVSQTEYVFVHYKEDDRYDEIICKRDNIDFTTIFERGQLIKVSGANIPINNNIFEIVNIYNEVFNNIDRSFIQIRGTLTDEIFNNTNEITINSLYTLLINHCQINCTNHVIKALDNNDFSYCRLTKTDIQGDQIIIGNNKLIYDSEYVINVGKTNANFTTLYDAVNSINDSNPINRYLIILEKGYYYESKQINLPDFVSIEGNGSILIFDKNNLEYQNNIALTVGNYNKLNNILFYQQNTISENIDNELILIGSNNLFEEIEDNAVSKLGLEITNCKINIDFLEENDEYTTYNITAIKLLKTYSNLNNIEISISTQGSIIEQQNINGLNLILGNHKIDNPIINIEGTNNQNIDIYGIKNDRVISQIFNPKINLSSLGITNVNNYGIYLNNSTESNINLTSISEYINIIENGEIRSYNGTNNNSVYVDYNSTLYLRNTTYEGLAYFRNNSLNEYPNSVLKTFNCLSIISDVNNNIIDYILTDSYGNAKISNILYGNYIGSIEMNGNRNILYGSNIGQNLYNGSNNIIYGYNLNNNNNSSSETIIIGQNTANNINDSNHIIIGQNTANNLETGKNTQVIGNNTAVNSNNINNVSILGSNTASNLSNSSNMVILGNNNLNNMNNSQLNTIVGVNIGNNIESGDKNVTIGNNLLNETYLINDSLTLGSEILNNAYSLSNTISLGNNIGSNIYESINSLLIGNNISKNINAGSSISNSLILGMNNTNNINSNITDTIVIGNNIAQNLNDSSQVIILGNQDTCSNLSTGNKNIVIGSNTGTSMTTNNKNIIIGHDAAASLDGTNDIIIIGTNSGSNISGSNDSNGKSIIIGNDAGQTINSGYSILLGHEAGKNASTSESIIIGNEAGKTLTGNRSILIGNYTAGIGSNPEINPVVGSDNILVGNYAGYSLTEGNYNVVLGSGDSSNGSAGYDLTSGSGNFLLGYLSGRNLTTGNYNMLFGRNAGYNMNESSRNFIMGDNAGYYLGSNDVDPAYLSNDNMILGNYAGYNVKVGTGLLMIGLEAGYLSNNSIDNLYIGRRSGYSNQFGVENTFIGNESGFLNTGSQSTMIGVKAGKFSSSSTRNTYVGYQAGKGKGESVELNNTGDQIIAIGYNAGSNLVSGYQSVLIGNNAGENNENGAKNIMFGPNAGQNSNSSKSIFIGSTESNNSGIGINTSGNYDIFIGINAGENNTTGSEDIFIGSHAGSKNTTGSNDIFIGDDAGKENTIGNNSIKIGKQAGQNGVSSNNVIIIGSEAGKSAECNDAILIGRQSGMNNTANGSIFIGQESGKNNSNGSGSIMIGPQAGMNNEHGNNCIYIGQNAGRNFNRSVDTQGENINIGSNSGANNINGIKNISIGHETLEQCSNGSGIIAIGYQAAKNIGDSSNINEDYNLIAIGKNAVSTGDININNTLIGSNVGLNVNNKDKFKGNSFIGADAGKNADLAINSIILGNSGRIGTNGENNIIAGFQAGDNLGLNNFRRFNISSNLTRGLNYIYIDNIRGLYGELSYYIKINDYILITDGINNIESVVTNIEYESNNNRTKISFSNIYNNETSINTGSFLFVLSKVDIDNIGFTDKSKGSSNTLMGNLTGQNLKAGSKNVSLGDRSMFNNLIGKYNNILGTEAGYNIKSDNNTLFGTRTGYNLDSYIGNSNIINNYTAFTIYENAIIPGDLYFNNDGILELRGTSNYPLSGFNNNFDIGDIIDISGTSANDGRYKIYDVDSTGIVLEGLPKIDQLGVDKNIDPNNLIINGAKYNFTDVETNNANNYIVNKTVSFDQSSLQYRQYSFISNPTNDIGSLFSNTYVIKITGSKYNDGIHYLYKDTSELDNTVLRTYSILYPETFDSNVIISSTSITSTNLIDSNDISFYNINNKGKLSSFLGRAKGNYNNINDNKYLNFSYLAPVNESIYVSDDLSSKRLNNYNNSLNVIYSTGYNEEFNINNNDYNLVKYYDFMINGNITIDSSNSLIIFSKPIQLDTGTDEVYYIKGTTNNDILINVNNKITLDNTIYNISSKDNINVLIDEFIISNISNPVYLIKQEISAISRDISSIFSNGSIINMNLNHYLGSKTENGAYIVETTTTGNKKLILNRECVIPNLTDTLSNTNTQLNISNTLVENVKLNINKDIYNVDTEYLTNKSSHINSYDIFFQTGSINDIEMTFDNTTKTIITASNLGFKNIVAPCMIKIDDEYYLVESNKYPFNTLEINNSYTLPTLTTTSNISYHSISVNNGLIDLAAKLEPGETYRVFGNDYNNDILITTISEYTGNNPIGISSAYLTESSNITNQQSNNKLLMIESVHDEYINSPNLIKGYGPGYFKHLEIDNANISINYNNKNLLSNSEYENIAFLEYLEITGSKVVLIPDIDNNEKYKLMVYYTIDSFNDMSSGIIDTFDGTNILNEITSLNNNFSLYGIEFNQFKISTYGYLLFENTATNDIFTVNFLTRNYETNYITTSRAISNIKTKYISSASGNNDILLIDFNVDGDGSNGYNNCQIKLYLVNSEFSGLIEFNYSNINRLFYDDYEYQISNIKYIVGMENSYVSVKENRYTNENFDSAISPFLVNTNSNSSSITNINNKVITMNPLRYMDVIDNNPVYYFYNNILDVNNNKLVSINNSQEVVSYTLNSSNIEEYLATGINFELLDLNDNKINPFNTKYSINSNNKIFFYYSSQNQLILYDLNLSNSSELNNNRVVFSRGGIDGLTYPKINDNNIFLFARKVTSPYNSNLYIWNINKFDESNIANSQTRIELDNNSDGSLDFAVNNNYIALPNVTTSSNSSVDIYKINIIDEDYILDSKISINASDNTTNQIDMYGNKIVLSETNKLAVLASNARINGSSNIGALYIYDLNLNYDSNTIINSEYILSDLDYANATINIYDNNLVVSIDDSYNTYMYNLNNMSNIIDSKSIITAPIDSSWSLRIRINDTKIFYGESSIEYAYNSLDNNYKSGSYYINLNSGYEYLNINAAFNANVILDSEIKIDKYDNKISRTDQFFNNYDVINDFNKLVSLSNSSYTFYDLNKYDNNNIVNNSFIIEESSFVPYKLAISNTHLLVTGTTSSYTTKLYDISNYDESNITSNYNIISDSTSNILYQGIYTYGDSIAISDSYVAIGNYGYDNGNGAVFLYDISTFNTTNITSTNVIITPYDSGTSNLSYGYKQIALSDDYLAVNANDMSGNNAVYLYDLSTFNQTSIMNSNIKLQPSNLNFGRGIEINGDNIAISEYDNQSIFIYNLSNFVESNILNSVIQIQYPTKTSFGRTIAYRNNYLASSYITTQNEGKILLFDTSNMTSNTVIENTAVEIEPSNSFSNDNYGISLDLNNNKLIVRSALTSNTYTPLYLYDLLKTQIGDYFNGTYTINNDNNSYDEILIKNSNIQIINENIGYGLTSDLDGNIAVIVSDLDYPNVESSNIRLYNISGSNSNTIENTEINLINEIGDNYYVSVSLKDNKLAVGAPSSSGSTGAVYLFDLSNFNSFNIINSKMILEASNTGGTGSEFGKSVLIHNNKLVVGAPSDSSFKLRSGSLFIYDLGTFNNINNIRNTEIKLYSSNSQVDAYYGSSIAMNDKYLSVGEFIFNKNGSIYLYNIENLTYDAINSSVIRVVPYGSELGDLFGFSMSLTDNDKLFVSAPNMNNNEGIVYGYDLSNFDSSNISNSEITLHGPNSINYGYSLDTYKNNLIVTTGIDSSSKISNVFIYNINDFNNYSIANTVSSFDIDNTTSNINSDFGTLISMNKSDYKFVVSSYNKGFTVFDLSSNYKNEYTTGYTSSTSDIITLTDSELGTDISLGFTNFSDIEIKRNGQILFRNNTLNQYYLNVLKSDIGNFDTIYYKIDNEILDIFYEKNYSVVHSKIYLNDHYNESNPKPGRIELKYYNIDDEFGNSNIIAGLNMPVYNNYTKTNFNENNSYLLTFNNVNDYNDTFDLLRTDDLCKIDTITGDNYNYIKETGNDYIIIYNQNITLDININANLTVNEYVSYDHSSNLGRFDFEKARKLVGEHSNYLRFSKLRQSKLMELYATNSLTHNNYSNLSIIDKSLNFSIDTSIFDNNNNFIEGVEKTYIIPIKEIVPNEYNNSILDDANIALINDNYVISLGEPVEDVGSNIILQYENINTQPRGFFDVFINNIDTDTNNNDNLIFSSNITLNMGNIINTEKYNGNIIANNGELEFTNLKINDSVGKVLTTKYGGIKKVSNIKPFAKLKPGNIITIYLNDEYINSNLEDSSYLINSFDSSNGLIINYDTSFNSSNISLTSFNDSDKLEIKILGIYNNSNGSNTNINGQLINERINFKNFTNPNSESTIDDSNNYLAIINDPISQINNGSIPIYNNYMIPDWSINRVLTNSFSDISNQNTLLFNYNGNYISNDNVILDYGSHTLLIPESNIYITTKTNLRFKNSSQYLQNIILDISSNTIQNDTGGTIDFTDFENGQLINLYNPSEDKNLFFKVDDSTLITSSILTLDSSYELMDYNINYIISQIGEGNSEYNVQSANIYSNVIISDNTENANLAVYNQGSKIIISGTKFNNGLWKLTNGSISTAKCILINGNISNEEPNYCLIQKNILLNESGYIDNANVTINSIDKTITTTDNTNIFVDFIKTQDIELLNTLNNDGSYYINEEALANTLYLSEGQNMLVDETISGCMISKKIKISKVGIPIITTTNNKVSIFHYEDAQGNNMMLGSFTGQFCGIKNLAIHNTYIGNKVGQTNHGSGNLLLGNETGFATSPTDSETFYNNKLAIYKNNFIGVPNNPLIGGDFGTGRVGINTIDPDSLVYSGTLDSTTRLVVNGGVRASSHSTFTGTHIILLDDDIKINNLRPGLCMVSSGYVKRVGNNILDTIVKCRPSFKKNDKKIYGVYSHHEYVNNELKVYVAAVGEGMMFVSNINGELENGDYITTSNIEGLGQLQDDDLLHNYTVAKVTENIDWSTEYNLGTYNNIEYKYKLVSVTYHCG